MLIYLGLICNENMQIEGFWYHLFTGVFEAATIHYAVAKIFGPLVFGRGWCGYVCWTAMMLDFLPYKMPQQSGKKIGWIRYITFVLSVVFAVSTGLIIVVANLFGAGQKEKITDYVKSTVFYNTILGITICMVWFVNAPAILQFFRIDESIIGYSISYVKICSLFFLFVGMDSALQAMLQGTTLRGGINFVYYRKRYVRI